MTDRSTHIAVHLRKAYANFNLDVDFETDAALTAIFGPSGAGKTTLVNCLAGIEQPDAGKISVNGTSLYDSDTAVAMASHARRIGYVFQDARLFPHLTVEGNLRFGQPYVPEGDRWAEWDQIIRLLGIRHLLDRAPHQLSGGETQRIAIGRALLTSPHMVLMDEPLASLDPARRLEIMPFIEHIRDDLNLPIIYVSHNVDEIVRLADQVVMLDQGKVTTQGPLADILNRLDVQTTFTPATFGEGGADLGTIIDSTILEPDAGHHLSSLSVGDDVIYVPQLALAKGQSLRLRIQARDVALALERPSQASILNVLDGTVNEINETSPVHVDVKVTTSGRHMLWARITRRSCQELGLNKGVPVYALIKSVAIESGLPKTKRQR